MWKRIKLIFKSIKDFVMSLMKNAINHLKNGVNQLGFWVVPTIAVSGYLLLMLPQLAVFAVIASFTSGIQDPVLKFLTGLGVFAVTEFLLITVAWYVVVLLGLPEMLRFSCYIQASYKKRLAEEEIRETEGKEFSVSAAYHQLQNHGAPIG